MDCDERMERFLSALGFSFGELEEKYSSSGGVKILIGGMSYSGKTTLASMVSWHLGKAGVDHVVFNTGDVFRKRAEELGMDLLEFHERASMEELARLDMEADHLFLETVLGEENVLATGRMACIVGAIARRIQPGSRVLSVWLEVGDKNVLMERARQRDWSYNPPPGDVFARDRKDVERYRGLYGFAPDGSCCDLVVDTSHKTPEDTWRTVRDRIYSLLGL